MNSGLWGASVATQTGAVIGSEPERRLKRRDSRMNRELQFLPPSGRPVHQVPRRRRCLAGTGCLWSGLSSVRGCTRTAGPAGGSGSVGLLKSTSTHDLAQYTSVKGPVTITVGPGVRAVQVRGCKPWVRLGDTLDDAIAAAVPPGTSAVPGGDGLFVVGLEFGPGVYRTAGQAGGAGLWAC